MKTIPNIITSLRILLSLILLFSKPYSLMFWIVFSICGVSDMIDGYIARKTNSTSRLGSLLDSYADIVFMSVVLIVILPTISVSKGILIWIIIIASIRTVSILIGYCKFHTFTVLHTYSNKATGFVLFCFPYLYKFIGINISSIIICTIASLSAIEELVINITSKELSRDNKGIFGAHS